MQATAALGAKTKAQSDPRVFREVLCPECSRSYGVGPGEGRETRKPRQPGLSILASAKCSAG